MRIVQVIPSLAKGGAERVVVDLVNAMAGRGHEVTVVTAGTTPVEECAGKLDSGVAIRVIDERGSRISQYLHLLSWTRFNREWLLSQDVLHCHLTFGSTFGMMASLLRKKGRQPAIIGTYHSVGMPIPWPLRAAHAAMLKFSDAVAFMAEDAYWRSFRARNPQLLTAVIENGVITAAAPTRQQAADVYRTEVGIPKDAFVVGTVGRLKGERRPNIILESFVKAAGSDESVHLLMAGDGPERKALQAEAVRLGLQDRIHLPGLIQEPTLAFANIDLYITLNVGSVTGVAALEAAVFGLPMVAFQMIPDRLDQTTDWIWSSPDTDELASQIRELIANPEARGALAQRQRRHVLDHLGIDEMVNAYEGLYAQALRRRGAHKPPAEESFSRCL